MIVKSKSGPILGAYILGGLVGIAAYIIAVILDSGLSIESFFEKKSLGCLVIICIFWYAIFCIWVVDCKTIIFDYTGCELHLWKFKKRYKWNEFKSIRLEYYKRGSEDQRRGIVFSKRMIPKMHMDHPAVNIMTRPYMSYFYVTFSVDEKDKKERMFDKESVDAYVVDEEEFMTKMKEWNVPIENCLPEEMKADYPWKYENLK